MTFQQNGLAPIDLDDLEPIEIPVKVKGVVKYVLREADVGATNKWRNFMMKTVKPGPDGKPTSFDGAADAPAYLLGMCLFVADPTTGKMLTEKGKPVPVGDVVKTWKNEVVENLFNQLKRISNLDEGEAETEESLTAEIAERQAKLDRLRAGGKQGTNPL